MAKTICTSTQPVFDNVPVFDVQPGTFVVDHWTVPRGPGTLGVAYVRRVLKPAKWDIAVERRWWLRCRGDVYFGQAPEALVPILRVPCTSTP